MMGRITAGFGAFALLLLAPTASFAQDGGDYGGGDYGGSSPPPTQPSKPREPKPLSRADFDEVSGRLFAAGDTNHDGTITLAEFNAIIDAAKDRAIRARFDQIDTDHNQSLSLAEFAQWQRTMGSAVLTDGPETAGAGLIAEEVRIDPGRGEQGQLAARMLAPMTATALAEANEDYDGGVSLAEFVAWEGKNFEKADTNNDGWVSFAEIDMAKDAASRAPRGGPAPRN